MHIFQVTPLIAWKDKHLRVFVLSVLPCNVSSPSWVFYNYSRSVAQNSFLWILLYFFFCFQGCHTHLIFILKLKLIRLFGPIFATMYCWFRKFKKVFCSKFYRKYYESVQCNFKILETHKLYKPAFTYSKAIMEAQEQGVKSGEI